MPSDTLSFVTDILGQFTPQRPITPEAHLIKDLELDSVDVMDALQQVEDEFGLIIPTDILPRLQTVADLVAEVERRQSERGGRA